VSRDDNERVHLVDLYLETLARSAPDVLVRQHVHASLPRNVVAIGKCAGALLDGVASVHGVDAAFAAIPDGYPLPRTNAQIHIGGHPHMTTASFAAGRALLVFVEQHHDILFLISGGGSACVEVALAPHTDDDVAQANAHLIASGLTIAEINRERRKLSAIKGGKLRDRVRGKSVTLVYSDVSTGALADVASGPTITNANEAILIADNATLTNIAAQIIGNNAVVLDTQIECDVEQAAQQLAAHADTLEPNQILVAGGEPTVQVRGAGKGGRCSELAVRFAALSSTEALFASSDGVDGNSGAAGIYLSPSRTYGRQGVEATQLRDALARSDSYRLAAQIGEPIMIAPTGNNLRDLFLIARN
jgi:hydroxypyruvate reductase